MYIGSIFIAICAVCEVLSSFLLMNEVTATHLRSTFGAIGISGQYVCRVINVLIFYFSDSWRFCFIIGSIFNLLVMLLFYFFSLESPRYYLKSKEIDLFINNLKEISIRNGLYEQFNKNVLTVYNKELTEETKIIEENYITVDSNKDNINEVKKDEETESFVSKNSKEILADEDEIKKIVNQLKLIKLIDQNGKDQQTHGFFSLLTYKSQRCTFLILCFIWFATSGTYYGLSINIKNLPGNIYSNGIMIYISEIFGCFLAGWLMNIKGLGRRHTMAMFFIISFIVYLILIVIKIQDTSRLSSLSFLE